MLPYKHHCTIISPFVPAVLLLLWSAVVTAEWGGGWKENVRIMNSTLRRSTRSMEEGV